eukprot:190732-Chlamydomonas_euryale.AAC.13
MSVCHAASNVLPAERITLQVSIKLRIPKVLKAPLPWQQQVLDQKRGRHNTQPIVSPTCAPQLLHRSIHKWIARLTLPPGLEGCLVESPWAVAKMRQQAALVDEWEEEGQVPCVLAIAHLPQEVGTALPLVQAHSSCLHLELLGLSR